MNLIEIRNVTKYYGKKMALENVSLDIPQGRIIGLLGANGAGKSTLMRCILGFLKYQGEISITDQQVSEDPSSLFNYIAFIPDVNSLDDRLTVQQTIDYVAALNNSWNAAKAEALLASSELPLKEKVSSLSKGMKTKLYLLITLSLDVKVLLLDEPTLGLDIIFRKEFFNTILGEFYDEDKTIIISTHQVEEVEQILQEIIFIDRGRILAHEEVETLKNRYAVATVSADREADLMAANPLFTSRHLGSVSGLVNAADVPAGAQVSRPGLSDIFLGMVKENSGGSHA